MRIRAPLISLESVQARGILVWQEHIRPLRTDLLVHPSGALLPHGCSSSTQIAACLALRESSDTTSDSFWE